VAATARNQSISAVYSHVKSGKYLQTYFLYGDDAHSLGEASSALYNGLKKITSSDMDCYEFTGEDNSMAEVTSAASMYPFSGGSKAILFKDFEKVKDDKLLDDYLKANYDFTHLVIVYSGTIKSFEKGYLKELKKRECLFEALKPRAGDLIEWIMERVRQREKSISKEGAQLLLELCGDEKYMIEMQLDKIAAYLGEQKSITPQVILDLSSVTKQYQLYDLHAAVANRDGERILKIGFNMLERNESVIGIISSLTKFFTNVTRLGKLNNARKNEGDIIKELGVTPNSFRNYQRARERYSDPHLLRIAEARLYTDLKLKTASPDEMMMFTYLAGVITGGANVSSLEEISL